MTIRLRPVSVCLVLLIVGCGKSPTTPGTGEHSPSAKREASPGGKTASVPSATSPQPVDEIPSYLRDAVQRIAANRKDEALQQLNQIIQEHPQEAQAYSLRGGLYSSAGRDDQALVDLSKAIELAPGNGDYRHSRGLFLMTRRKFNEALQDFQEALRQNPRHPQARNHIGLISVSKGEFESAVQTFTEALSQDPQRTDILNNRGMAHWRAGHLESALKDFDAALQINPKNINALSNRGQLQLQQNRWNEALTDFTAATVQDPSNLMHFQHRQAALLRAGRLLDAEENGRHIVWMRDLGKRQREVQKNPQSLESRINLARHYVEGKEFALAFQVFDAVVKEHPQHVPALLGRAEMWMKQREWDKVVQDCTQALQHGESSEALSLRGDALLQLKQLDGAIRDFEACERFDLQVARAYHQRSQWKQAHGDATGAQADLQRAQELNPALSTTAASD